MLKNKSQVMKAFHKAAEAKRDADGEKLLDAMFSEYLGSLGTAEQTSGNIYEGWLSALQKGATRFPALGHLVGRYSAYRSGDSLASQAGTAQVQVGKARFHVHFKVELPFAASVEKGKTIGTISPKGRKEPSQIGKLLGRRMAGKFGMLLWVDEAGPHFAKIRVPRGRSDGVGAFAAGKEALISLAESLGWNRN